MALVACPPVTNPRPGTGGQATSGTLPATSEAKDKTMSDPLSLVLVIAGLAAVAFVVLKYVLAGCFT